MYVINEATKIVNIWTDNEINRQRLGSGKYGVVEYTGEVEEQGGVLYAKGYAPQKTVEEQNEAIRAKRESLYVMTSDKLKADYDEAVARGADNAEELKQIWLESKDKVRAENPYIIEE